MAGEGDVADNETEVAIFSFYPITTLIFWVLSSDHFYYALFFYPLNIPMFLFIVGFCKSDLTTELKKGC